MLVKPCVSGAVLLLVLAPAALATCPASYAVRVTGGAFAFEGSNQFTFDRSPSLVLFVGKTYTFTAADTSLTAEPLAFFATAGNATGDLCAGSPARCTTAGTYPLKGAAGSKFSVVATPALRNVSVSYGSSNAGGIWGNSVQVYDGTTYGRWVALALGIIIVAWLCLCATLAFLRTDKLRYTDEVRNWWNELGKSTRRPGIILAWMTIVYDCFQFITFSFIAGVPWFRGTASTSEIIVSLGLDLRGLGFLIVFWVFVGIYVLAGVALGLGELYLLVLRRFYASNKSLICEQEKRFGRWRIYVELVLLSLLFVICMRNMLNMLSCDYVDGLDGCVVEAEIACWQGIHWLYAAVAFIMIMTVLPFTYSHYLTKNERYDPAVKFISRFQVFNTTIKFGVCIIVAQSRIAPWAFISILLASRLIALFANLSLQPCITWQSVNNFNTAAHATEAFFAIMALVTLRLNNPDSYTTLVVALVLAPFVFLVFWVLNAKYQEQHHNSLTITFGAVGEVFTSPFRSRRSPAPSSGSSMELFSFGRKK